MLYSLCTRCVLVVYSLCTRCVLVVYSLCNFQDDPIPTTQRQARITLNVDVAFTRACLFICMCMCKYNDKSDPPCQHCFQYDDDRRYFVARTDFHHPSCVGREWRTERFDFSSAVVPVAAAMLRRRRRMGARLGGGDGGLSGEFLRVFLRVPLCSFVCIRDPLCAFVFLRVPLCSFVCIRDPLCAFVFSMFACSYPYFF